MRTAACLAALAIVGCGSSPSWHDGGIDSGTDAMLDAANSDDPTDALASDTSLPPEATCPNPSFGTMDLVYRRGSESAVRVCIPVGPPGFAIRTGGRRCDDAEASVRGFADGVTLLGVFVDATIDQVLRRGPFGAGSDVRFEARDTTWCTGVCEARSTTCPQLQITLPPTRNGAPIEVALPGRCSLDGPIYLGGPNHGQLVPDSSPFVIEHLRITTTANFTEFQNDAGVAFCDGGT